MSTWLDDIKKSNPALAKDYALVGNQSTTTLRNMVKALSGPLADFLNTPDDIARREAAKRILQARNKR